MEAKIRILHIDNDLHGRQLVIDTLRKDQHIFEITQTDSRDKFEQHFTEDRFDVILSEVNIQGFDHLQLLQKVKNEAPHLPVIVVTDTGSVETAVHAMKMGASDYIIKTADHIHELVPAINTVLLHKRLKQERKQIQPAPLDITDLYCSVYENTNIAILLTTAEGDVLYANKFTCNLFGYAGDEIRNTGWNELTLSPDLSLAALLEEWSKSERAKGELTFIKKDGSKFPAEVYPAVLPDKEYSKNVSMVIRDLTEQREIEKKLTIAREKAEERDQFKTALLQNISHEIRTPLNAVIGFSSFIKTNCLSEEKKDYCADIITQSADQLLSIVKNIVSISTMEAGQERINESEIDLNKTMKFLYNQFILRAKKQNILLQYTTDLTDENAFIKTDQPKLMEIFFNLLGNAFKFTCMGSVNFGYSVKGSELEFYVQDTGTGIPQEMYEEIFVRSRQLETSPVQESGSCGLGLSISKTFVEMLGGRIWLDSEYGEGSVFYFTIPYKKVNEIGSFSQELIYSDPHQETKKNLKILIAEDDESCFLLLKEYLTDTGLTILRAVTGSEAVEICRSEEQIDLILMDIKMPEMNGFDAINLIKEIRPHVPVIVQTAYVHDYDKKMALARGCADYVDKPVNREILMSMVDEHLMKA